MEAQLGFRQCEEVLPEVNWCVQSMLGIQGGYTVQVTAITQLSQVLRRCKSALSMEIP